MLLSLAYCFASALDRTCGGANFLGLWPVPTILWISTSLFEQIASALLAQMSQIAADGHVEPRPRGLSLAVILACRDRQAPGHARCTGCSRRAGTARSAGASRCRWRKGRQGGFRTANVRAVQADGPVNCESSETLVSVFCPTGGAPDGSKCGTTPTIGLCLRKP
jgi:hypothetical protein